MAKTALITGASRGIGREAARTLASEGWHVIAAVRDSAEVVDMADAASIEALAARLRERNQLLDALVNNAGIYKGPSPQIWAVNLLGPDMGGRNAPRSVAEGAARVLAGVA